MALQELPSSAKAVEHSPVKVASSSGSPLKQPKPCKMTYGVVRSFKKGHSNAPSEAQRYREQGLESDDDQPSQSVQSLHQLKESGEMKRFKDEMYDFHAFYEK